MTITEFKCPLCGGAMTAYPDAPKGEKSGSRDSRVFGVRLQCDNPCDPQVHESVYGHGGNEKEAYATACQKYIKPKQ